MTEAKYKSLATQFLQSRRRRHIITKGFQSGSKKKKKKSDKSTWKKPKKQFTRGCRQEVRFSWSCPFFLLYFFEKLLFLSVTGANISYEFWSVWANPNCILWPLALLGDPVSSDELGATEKVMTCTMPRVEPNNKSCFGGNWAVRVRLGSPESQYLRDPPPTSSSTGRG